MKELKQYQKFMGKEELHKSLNTLVGILEGILADNDVNKRESDELQNWYSLHAHLIDVQPFKELLPAITFAFEDETLDIEEAEGILWLCGRYLNKRQDKLYFDMVTSSIQQLEGMLHGFLSDGRLTDEELSTLGTWLSNNEQLSGIYPYDEIYSLLVSAKSDGVVSDDERNMLKAFFSTFVDVSESVNIHEDEVKKLQAEYSVGGICSVCPHITFEGKTFCFTGVSTRGRRVDFAHKVTLAGGIYNDSVVKDTDYLIVGADGNPCWAFSCYGRKVEKAVNMRKTGHKIVIIHENDFWDEISI